MRYRWNAAVVSAVAAAALVSVPFSGDDGSRGPEPAGVSGLVVGEPVPIPSLPLASPQGTWIAMRADLGEERIGLALHRVSDLSGGVVWESPFLTPLAFSLDDTWLLVDEWLGPGEQRLALVEAATGDIEVLPFHGDAAFTPDSSWLLLDIGPASDAELWSIRLSDMTTTLLDRGRVVRRHPGISALMAGDGITVVYDRSHGDRAADLWSVPITGGVPVRINHPEAVETGSGAHRYTLSPDGSRVLYVARPSGEPATLFSAAVDGTDLRRVDLGDPGLLVRGIEVLSDGVLVLARTGEDRPVFWCEHDGTGVRRLPGFGDLSGVMNLYVAPDESFAVFDTRDGIVGTVPLPEGEPATLFTDGLVPWSQHPDDPQSPVLWTTPNAHAAGLWGPTPATFAPIPVTDDYDPVVGLGGGDGTLLDGHYLVYRRNTTSPEQPTDLYARAFVSGAEARLSPPLPEGEWVLDVVVLPDGRHVAYSTGWAEVIEERVDYHITGTFLLEVGEARD